LLFRGGSGEAGKIHGEIMGLFHKVPSLMK
jgi:hypothetical protein